MIGRSKMNDRSHDMTPSEMLLDVSVWSTTKKDGKKNSKKKPNKHLIFIRLRKTGSLF